MHFLQRTLPSPAENLALDEALLLAAEANQGPELLRFWEWPAPAVVLGSGCRLTEDVNAVACAADQVPVLRRASGGGTVLLGTGCLCYSLVLSLGQNEALATIRSSYAYILDRLGEALGQLVPGIARAGISDLVVAGRKFSGNAQQRKQRYLLHHGTLLYAFDPAPVSRYLHLPVRQPEYRTGRTHGDFLTNLPLPLDALQRQLRSAWDAVLETDAWPRELVQQLVREKYRQPEWIARR